MKGRKMGGKGKRRVREGGVRDVQVAGCRRYRGCVGKDHTVKRRPRLRSENIISVSAALTFGFPSAARPLAAQLFHFLGCDLEIQHTT